MLQLVVADFMVIIAQDYVFDTDAYCISVVLAWRISDYLVTVSSTTAGSCTISD